MKNALQHYINTDQSKNKWNRKIIEKIQTQKLVLGEKKSTKYKMPLARPEKNRQDSDF